MPYSVEGKDKNEILKALATTTEPGARIYEHLMMGIFRCTEDLEKALRSLEKSMNGNAGASDRLAKKVFWLNVILTIATAVGTAAALAPLFMLCIRK